MDNRVGYFFSVNTNFKQVSISVWANEHDQIAYANSFDVVVVSVEHVNVCYPVFACAV